MTVDRGTVSQALESASALGYRTVKDIASAMGINGSSPLIKAVREELEAMAKDGLCDVRDHVKAGQMFRAKGVQVSAKMPTAVHRMMALIADGPKKAYELADAGIQASTMGYAADRGIAVRRPDGYEITDRGLAWLADKEAEFPALAEARAAMGRASGPAQEPGPEEPEPEPEQEPAGEPMPEPEPMQAPVQEPEPEAPHIGEPRNAVIEGIRIAYTVALRTAGGRMTVAINGLDGRVFGGDADAEMAVGRAVRIRLNGGRPEVGHIVDDAWEACL